MKTNSDDIELELKVLNIWMFFYNQTKHALRQEKKEYHTNGMKYNHFLNAKNIFENNLCRTLQAVKIGVYATSWKMKIFFLHFFDQQCQFLICFV